MSLGNDLKSLFYASIDESSICTFLSRMGKLTEAERRLQPGCIGEGIHFQSFEINSKPLRLVVNVAKATFLTRGDGALSRWQEAVNLVRSLEADTLIPPMDIIKASGLVAIVMPKGQDLSRDHAKSLSVKLIDTAKALSSIGLVLDDYPQVREALGVPFIIDWSDLSFAGQRSLINQPNR